MKNWNLTKSGLLATLLLIAGLFGQAQAQAHEPVNICNALEPRALNVAEIIYNRINPTFGGWVGWNRKEGLTCKIDDYDKVTYRRSCNGSSYDQCSGNDAVVIFGNIHPSDFDINDWGTPEVISSEVTNEYSQEVNIPAGASLSHTWGTSVTHTDSLLQTVTVGLQARSLTILGSVYQGQFSEQIEVQISTSYAKQFGSTDTKVTNDSTTLTETGPKKGRFLFERTTTKERRTILSNIDLEHTMTFISVYHDPGFPASNSSYYHAGSMTELLQGAEDLLPDNHNLAPLFRQHRAFYPRGRKANEEEIALLKQPANSPVEMSATYSNVNDKFIFVESDEEHPIIGSESK